MDPCYRRCSGHDLEEDWRPASPVHLSERRVDGDQDRQVHQVLSPDGGVESWLEELHDWQGYVVGHKPRKTPQGGTSRYWGVIAFCRSTPIRKDRFALGLSYVALAMFFAFLGYVLFAVVAAVVHETHENRPIPTQQHAPSDLDKGRNPSSYERGQAGPPGPPGSLPALPAGAPELDPDN